MTQKKKKKQLKYTASVAQQWQVNDFTFTYKSTGLRPTKNTTDKNIEVITATTEPEGKIIKKMFNLHLVKVAQV